MPKVPKSTRTLNKLVSSHIPPSQDSLCICIRDFTKMILGLAKNNNNLPLPPSSDEVDTATLFNITDVEIDSLVVEERNIATEEASQTRWDGLVIDILVKHWLYAKNKEAFQEYPLQSDFCTKTIVSAIVERWLRGQKASYGKDKITNQNLSRIKKKLFQNRLHMAKKLLGCETASQIIPHMNCISDTEEDEDGNLLCIESNWRHNKYSLLLHLLDTNTICSIRDRKGNNAANRCLESHRIIARNDSDQTACPGLPSNCYSEEFLNGLNATHKLSLSIQKPCVQLDQHIFSITPQHILAEANVHP
ncbi:hypothetical protein PPACK8108_LOCUS16002 [Phakopsora pachyrhizi]|uniref:Uncharacterized protein n=1 Tax=Phakopsora pachyrhizi TaxID=170000 RepID=A0AAV0B793_PHAPC|nr:hypothetical protein PPACK8108_LOCUS15075 [Phakopsora pachyrhizi]CAH7682856.1 hypothetical protein PPACK8108_LOCUS16002 [Phakopsora pachyrhizi]